MPSSTIPARSFPAAGTWRRAVVDVGVNLAELDAGPVLVHQATMAGVTAETPFMERAGLTAGRPVEGPAVLIEATATTVVEPGSDTEARDVPLGDCRDLMLAWRGRQKRIFSIEGWCGRPESNRHGLPAQAF